MNNTPARTNTKHREQSKMRGSRVWGATKWSIFCLSCYPFSPLFALIYGLRLVWTLAIKQTPNSLRFYSFARIYFDSLSCSTSVKLPSLAPTLSSFYGFIYPDSSGGCRSFPSFSSMYTGTRRGWRCFLTPFSHCIKSKGFLSLLSGGNRLVQVCYKFILWGKEH